MFRNAFAVAVLFIICMRSQSQDSLRGVGAAGPGEAYSQLISAYEKTHPGINISYSPSGSGLGVRGVMSGDLDFGATDGPLSDSMVAQSHNTILHVPMLSTAIVPVYNLPGLKSIKFSPDVIAGIALGLITNWQDSAIKKDNPDLNLPNLSVSFIHRSDGCGATLWLSYYLSTISSKWKDAVGYDTVVKWPAGLSASHNEGIEALVEQTSGAVGFIEYSFAVQKQITFAPVQNKAGRYVLASPESMMAAASSVPTWPDYRGQAVDSNQTDAYPITSYTWLIIPLRTLDSANGKPLLDFVNWSLDNADSVVSASTGFVAVPKRVSSSLHETLRSRSNIELAVQGKRPQPTEMQSETRETRKDSVVDTLLGVAGAVAQQRANTMPSSASSDSARQHSPMSASGNPSANQNALTDSSGGNASPSQLVSGIAPGQCTRTEYNSGQLWIANSCSLPVTVSWTSDSGNSWGQTDVGAGGRAMVSSAGVGYNPKTDGIAHLFTCPQGMNPVMPNGGSLPNNYTGKFLCHK